MSQQVPVLLLTDRDDIADAFLGDPGSNRYALEVVDPDDITVEAIAQSYPTVILDFRGLEAGPDLVRTLKGVNDEVEILCIVDAPNEREAVEALRHGAFDYQIWPAREAGGVWQMLSRCLAHVAPPAPTAPNKIGEFEIHRRLGAGGMAEVFLAEDREGDQVVVKVMHAHMASQLKFQDMFMDEARITAPLDHGNIVQVRDFGRTRDDRLFIVMEYVRGWNLQQLGVMAEWDVPVHVALFLVAEVCTGLQYAHTATDVEGRALDIVHRDINPPNILIREDGWVKITDFGIAKAKDRYSETTVGALKGKLSFMSPEQVVSGAHIDSRADIFAAGIVLYQLLTGRHPFDAPTPFDMMMRIREGDLEPPSAVAPDVPETIEAIVMRALATRAADRYPTAAEMEVLLRGQLGSDGIETCSRADLSEWAAIVGHGLWRREGTPKPVVPAEHAQSPTAITGGFAGTPSSDFGAIRVVGGATVVPQDPDETMIRQTVGVASEPKLSGPDPDETKPPPGQTTAPPVADVVDAAGDEEETVWQDDSPSKERTKSTPVTIGLSTPPDEPPSRATPATPASADTGSGRDPAPVQPVRPPTRGDSAEPLFPVSKRQAELQQYVRYGMAAVGFVALVAVGAVVGQMMLDRPNPTPSVAPSKTPVTRRTRTRRTPTRKRVVPTSPPATEVVRKAETPQPTTTPRKTAVVQKTATPRRAPTPSRTQVARPTPTPRRTPVASNTTPPPPPKPRNGTLSIMVSGWASVTIDGKRRGNAPVAGLVLPEGKYRVVLENEHTGARRAYTVVIKPNRETRLRAELK